VKTYAVTAKRWARGWELHIEGIGVTQSHGLADADEMARDYIADAEEVSPDSFAVNITPEVGGGIDAAVKAARGAMKAAEEAQKVAAAQVRQAVVQLKAAGLTGADVAAYLGVSAQRVSQLAPNKQPAKRGDTANSAIRGRVGKTPRATKATSRSRAAGRKSA